MTNIFELSKAISKKFDESIMKGLTEKQPWEDTPEHKAKFEAWMNSFLTKGD
jgi:hypothetical protein